MMDDTRLNDKHAALMISEGQKRLEASSRLHRKRQEDDYYDDEDNEIDEESGHLLYQDQDETNDAMEEGETPDS